jgi:transcriptional regulator with XRE-family HTH domain
MGPMGPTATQIGAWLQELRERRGVARDVAAHRVGTKERTLFRWEKGENPAPADKFFALVELYDAAEELPALLAKWERATRSAAAVARAGEGKRHGG